MEYIPPSKRKKFAGVKFDECSRKYQAILDGKVIGLYSSEIEAALMRAREIKKKGK
jgi:hypothetical protein